MSDDSYNGIIATQQSAGHPMTSLSDLARKAGFLKADYGGNTYIASMQDIERLLALHVQELCADVEPVYQLRFKDSANWCDCSPNQYEVTSQDSQNYETRILYPASTVAALRARVAELQVALQMGYSETMDYIKLNKLGAENNQWLRLAREALRSKK